MKHVLYKTFARKKPLGLGKANIKSSIFKIFSVLGGCYAIF